MKDNNVGIYVYIKDLGITAKVYKSVGDRGFAVTWTDSQNMNDNGDIVENRGHSPTIHNRFVSKDEVEIKGSGLPF